MHYNNGAKEISGLAFTLLYLVIHHCFFKSYFSLLPCLT